jgi:hypothetical protein
LRSKIKFFPPPYGERNFVETRLLVMNCEAGMSPSAGIAAALGQFYNHDGTFFFGNYSA